MTIITNASQPTKIIGVTKTTKSIDSSQSTKIIGVTKTTKSVNSKIQNFMDTSRFRYNQTPTPAPDGAQVIFTLPNSESYVTGLLEVFLDGLQQIKTTDWSETSLNSFTFVNAPDSDENIRINYIKI